MRLRGRVQEEQTLARRGAERLWELLHTRDHVPALGALTGNQAVQMVKAGLEAIYLSGWQVAADANLAGQTYPDQSLYPANSVPAVVRRINNALLRADQIDLAPRAATRRADWLAPIVADAEAGFGGPLNAFELMKSMIAAGAAGVHWEDQLASEKKCGHMGGKVLVPTAPARPDAERRPAGRRRLGVPTLVVARTDALAADLLTSDVDARDQPFITGERTAEGFYRVTQRPGAGASPGPGVRPVRRPDLGGDRHAGPRRWPASSPTRAAHGVPRQDAGLQLLAVVQLARARWTTPRSPRFQDELGELGYALPVHHPGRLPRAEPLDVRPGPAATPTSGMTRLRRAAGGASSRTRPPATPRSSTRPRSAPATSTRWPPRSTRDSGTLALAGSTEEEQFH